MKLGEKIFECRKRMNLTQDELAEKLNVSRQSVSKWETGAAYPEPNTLLQLSKILGVSCDCLLDDSMELPSCESADTDSRKSSAASAQDDALKSLPSFMRNACLKYGWILGIYVAAGGFFMTIIGIVAKVISRYIVNGFTSLSYQISPPFSSGYDIIFDKEIGSISDSAFANQGFPNPVDILATFMIVIGAIVLTAGIILAVYLRKYGKNRIEK